MVLELNSLSVMKIQHSKLKRSPVIEKRKVEDLCPRPNGQEGKLVAYEIQKVQNPNERKQRPNASEAQETQA